MTARARQGCWVAGGLFALLVFAMPMAAGATADGPDRFRVVDLHPGNSLNIRSGPSASDPKIGRIPAGADGLLNLGCQGGLSFAEWQAASLAAREASRVQRWCKIEYGGVTGWVAGWHLGESALPASSGQTLRGTAWQMAEAGYAEVWIAFSETGGVSGSTGCNRITASFESGDTGVAISVIAVTRMACPDMERETKFLMALERAVRFTMTGDTLILRDGADGALISLVRRVGD